MLNNAVESAKKLLNDKSLKILGYSETDNYYLFDYGINNKPNFDNTLIKVDKKTNTASYYVITEHLNELTGLKYNKIDAK